MKKQECVFLWLYCLTSKPYKHYNEESIKNKNNKMFFLQMRWDNKFGTVGGKVDQGEELFSTLKREVKEEINHDLTKEQLLKIEKLETYELEKSIIHSYSLELSFEELISIRNNAVTAEHSISECNGYNLFRFESGLQAKMNITKLPFAGTGIMEAIKLIDKMEEKNEKENCN